VPVDIPLSETDLHGPFTSLRDLVAPYKSLAHGLPASWGEALCRQSQALCALAP
jgi:hypothetical protein